MTKTNSRPKFFQEEKNSNIIPQEEYNPFHKKKYDINYFDAKLRELNFKIKNLETSVPSKAIQELKERYNKLSDRLEPFEKEFDKIGKDYFEREIRQTQIICAVGSVIFGLIMGFGFGWGELSFLIFILVTLFFYFVFYYGIVRSISPIEDRTNFSFTLTEGVEYENPVYNEPFKRDETGGVVLRDETGTDFSFKVEKFFKDLLKFENDIIELESIIKAKQEKDEKRSRHIPQKVKDKVWNRDAGKCVDCGSNQNLEFDHIIPFSKGGANTYRNIQLLCEKCNRRKQSKIG